MRTLLDLATTYEARAKQDDEIANSIISHLCHCEPRMRACHLVDAISLREEARHFRVHAERLRQKHRHAATGQADDQLIQ
jgi:hypothetical protein